MYLRCNRAFTLYRPSRLVTEVRNQHFESDIAHTSLESTMQTFPSLDFTDIWNLITLTQRLHAWNFVIHNSEYLFFSFFFSIRNSKQIDTNVRS